MHALSNHQPTRAPTVRTDYCTLPPAEMRRRLVDAARLFARARSAQALADGARIVYGDDEEIARALFDFMVEERACCNSFAYSLHFAPDRATVALEIRGDRRAAPAIRSWVGESIALS